eukprot:gene20522-biopygen13407
MMKRETADDMLVVVGGAAAAANVSGGSGGVNDADATFTRELQSVDQFLNIKLLNISVVEPEKYPHMMSVKNCFIRGSVVRYVQLPQEHVDTALLQDSSRREVDAKSEK